ncbi:MAG TPA: hypothetical protein VFP97_14720 [Chitinophagaceae bacterium]|nr:hypothetical protein [Chitinophagaceae bacterium]
MVFEQDDVDAFAVTSSLQTIVHCPVNEKLSVMLGVGYYYLKPTFKNVEQRGSGITMYEPGGAANISIFSYIRRFNITQNMNTISLHGGLIYKL